MLNQRLRGVFDTALQTIDYQGFTPPAYVKIVTMLLI
jgi:hypothetical protein